MSNTRDHKRFVQNDGWEQYKTKSDHEFYRKCNPDGTWKRTKISRGYKDYGKGLFQHILKEQLQVTSEQFDSMI